MAETNSWIKYIGLKQFFGRIGLLLVNAAGTDIEALAEDDGTLKNSNYGKAGSTVTAFKVETTGEQDLVLHGKTAAAAIKALRVDANDILYVHPVEADRVQVDPVLIPNVEGVLWNPGSDAAILYEVRFNIVNSTATDVTGVNVGQDLAAGGGLTAVEYWAFGLIVPANGASGWYGPFILPGDDDVRGVAGTNNVLSIHWNIKRVYA